MYYRIAILTALCALLSGCDPCDMDADGYESAECGGADCDDTNGDTYPGADELCDGLDNDCNGRGLISCDQRIGA